MRAIFAAIARAMRAALGILWRPFEAVGSIFSGFGGGGGSTQDNAALVAEHAAKEEAARDVEMTADRAVTLDEVSTIKRVIGRLLLGKPISPETKISPSLLYMLTNAPRGVLKSLADADAETVASYVDGHREGLLKVRAANVGIPEAVVDARFPGLAGRAAKYKAARAEPEPTETSEGRRRRAA